MLLDLPPNVPGQYHRENYLWASCGTTNCVFIVYHTRKRKRDGAVIIEHLDSVWLLESEAEVRRRRLGANTAVFGIPMWGSGAAALEAGLRATWPPGLVEALDLPSGQTWEGGFHL